MRAEELHEDLVISSECTEHWIRFYLIGSISWHFEQMLPCVSSGGQDRSFQEQGRDDSFMLTL